MAIINAQNVQKIIWKNIITCFGIPCVIIIDNGLHFTNRKLNEFMIGLGIKH